MSKIKSILDTFFNKYYYIIGLVIILICVGVSTFFGTKKQGYYHDEFYSYTRANGTGIGIAINPGEWNNTDSFIEELTSNGAENFNYSQVYKNCGFHPPVYHYLLHFVSSIFSGTYSKWIGIGTNLLTLIVFLCLTWYVSYRIAGRDKIVSLLSLLFVGISPCVISQVVFIRMYLLLGTFVMWYAYLHLRDLDRDKISWFRFLLPVCLCGFLGFLTMYYFVIIMFAITFCYCFYLFFCCKRYADTIKYGLSATMSYVLSYLYFPVCIYYLKHGKGNKVLGNLVTNNVNDDRISFFFKLVNEHVFGRMMLVFLIMLILGCALIILKLKQGTRIKDLPYYVKAIILFGISSIFYFLVMLKVTVKAGDSTNRYCFCIYPLFIILMVIGSYKIFTRYKNIFKMPILCTLILCGLMTIIGFADKQVMYLYEDETVLNEWIDNNPDATFIMVDNLTNYDGRIADYIKYDSIFYSLRDDLSMLEDEKVMNSTNLLVYIENDDYDDQICLNKLLEINNNISSYENIYNTEKYNIYHLF